MGNELSGVIEEREHRFCLRVYFEDTDAAGIVYYANYLRFAERARTEMVRMLGIEHSSLMDENGLGIVFAVGRVEIDYLRSGRLDDLLEVKTRIVDVGGASLGLEQVVCRVADGEVLARIIVKLVCMTLAGKAKRIEGHLRQRLLEFVTERQN